MKKLLGIMVLGLLLSGNVYAGFFKSSLEKCADAETPIDEISPSQEWKKVEKSDLRKLTDKAEAKRIKKTCSGEGYSKCSSINDLAKSVEIIELERSYRRVKIRDIPLAERKRVAKKFFNQNLKKKLKYHKYETSFEFCTYDKKRNLELFNAKYD